MKVRLNPGTRLNGYRVSDKVYLTQSWTNVTKSVAERLLRSEYNGNPLVEVDDSSADKAEDETEAIDLQEDDS